MAIEVNKAPNIPLSEQAEISDALRTGFRQSIITRNGTAPVVDPVTVLFKTLPGLVASHDGETVTVNNTRYLAEGGTMPAKGTSWRRITTGSNF